MSFQYFHHSTCEYLCIIFSGTKLYLKGAWCFLNVTTFLRCTTYCMWLPEEANKTSAVGGNLAAPCSERPINPIGLKGHLSDSLLSPKQKPTAEKAKNTVSHWISFSDLYLMCQVGLGYVFWCNGKIQHHGQSQQSLKGKKRQMHSGSNGTFFGLYWGLGQNSG